MDATISGAIQTGQSLLPVIVSLVQTWHGLALPVLIDVINQYIANSKVRLWIAFIVCVTVSGILNYQEVLSISNWSDAGVVLAKMSFIFTQAHLVYKNFWENSQARVDLFGRSINK